MRNNYRVDAVATGSTAYQEVLKLWRRHSTTLGFMPEGGFEDAARAGTLIAALDDCSVVRGYIMYRRNTKQVASIVHLSVDESCRGEGVARRLFESMLQRSADCTEIRLRCRRDFEASRIWPRLGFVAAHEISGRGKDASALTIWRYSINELPLLRLLDSNTPSVVIDANVFFDLDDRKPGAEESLALQADWLSEFIELCVTEEIYNEIDRQDEASERQYQKQRVGQFRILPRRREREEEVLQTLFQIFPEPKDANAESDLKQLAMTIAGDAAVFVTRDTAILGVADEVYEKFALELMAPHEVVRQTDAVRREDAYRPKRLFLGPSIVSSLATATHLDELVRLAQGTNPGCEKAKQMEARLKGILASPHSHEVVTVRKGDTLLVAYALDRSRPGVLEVPLFASSSETLGKTAARHFLEEIIGLSAAEGRSALLVTKPSPSLESMLSHHGFFAVSDTWVHFSLHGVLNRSDAAAQLRNLGSALPMLSSETERRAQLLVEDEHDGLLERTLWPLKLTASKLRNFVVPIQPRWAKELFDIELARGTLFGARPELALAIENVYYRAARPQLPTSGARVLWYVSDDTAYPGTMAIRACSYVEEVEVGPVKEIFRKFRRLGVYTWSDVLATAKGDAFGHVMAFRFSGTERFTRPVDFRRAQEILGVCCGQKSQFQSPTEVTSTVFEAIYRSGMCLDED